MEPTSQANQSRESGHFVRLVGLADSPGLIIASFQVSSFELIPEGLRVVIRTVLALQLVLKAILQISEIILFLP